MTMYELVTERFVVYLQYELVTKLFVISLQYELVAELFEEKPDPNEKKQRAGSHPTQPPRSNPKGGKNMKKTVGSQVQKKRGSHIS